MSQYRIFTKSEKDPIFCEAFKISYKGVNFYTESNSGGYIPIDRLDIILPYEALSEDEYKELEELHEWWEQKNHSAKWHDELFSTLTFPNMRKFPKLYLSEFRKSKVEFEKYVAEVDAKHENDSKEKAKRELKSKMHDWLEIASKY